MRTWLFLLVSLFTAVFAQEESPGVLSFIEDGPALGRTEEGVYRSVPFVEVIETAKLDTCREQGFDQESCPVFERSLPFLPAQTATEAERVIAHAWFALETRAYHRTMLEIGAQKDVVACTLGGFDLFWLVFEGELFVPPDLFCDDKPFNVLGECFWSCDAVWPWVQCPSWGTDCLPCIERGIARALEHTFTVYWLDYLETVTTEVVGPLVTAGAALWTEGLLTDGALIAPVMQPENTPTVVQDVVTRLIPEGLEEDPRAASYYTQSAAQDVGCRRALGAGTLQGLRLMPGQTVDPNAPGLETLEEGKRDLASRESAGESAERGWQMIAEWDADALLPRYERGAGVSGLDARNGTALPTAHACLGFATFFQVFQEIETVAAGHRPILRPSACWVGWFYLPVGTVVPGVPPILTLAGPRFHTDWVATPEGYPIVRVRGEIRAP